MKLTNEQQAAVDARGGSITLSAAAGSGKTSVLTARVVARILDPEDPIDADRLLIVTFTRAAAAEMKGRIIARLTDHIRENPQDMRAKRQKTLLGRAQIGTIDALCTAILRENFQAAGICAGFRIGDEAEMNTMRGQVISDVLEEAYRDGTNAFCDLSELFSSAGSDSDLSDAIMSVLDFARSHPYYRSWMDEKLVIYRDFTHPRDSEWARMLFDRASELITLEKTRLEKTIEKVRADPELCVYDEVLGYDLSTLSLLQGRINARDWDGCIDVLEGYAPARIPSPRKVDKAKRDAVRDVRNHAKDLLQKELPGKIFPVREKDFAEDVADLLPKVDCLFSLVRQTDERLQNEKIAAGVLDFADLEQLVCTLLTREDGSSTPLAADLAARYDEVMLDESQDINEVQNRILTALSAKGGLFCVGDVKQCIYRFRMACPQLFLGRVAAGRPYDGKHFPATLYLNGNFRTVPEITDIINLMFSRLMSRRLGEVDYDETQALRSVGTFPGHEGHGVDICLVRDEKGLGEADENLSAEPAWVAGEIARLLKSGAEINDNGTMRPVRLCDIAILLRSPRSGAERYRRALRVAGIETHVALESGFLTSFEISTVINLLTVLANPMRDVEMLGTLSSPIGGFSDDELAAMRAKNPRGSIYAALCAYSEENARAEEFLREFESMRRLSLVLPPEELIGEILRRTGFDLVCRRMKRGEERGANLTLLQHYAGENTGEAVPSLTGFLRRIERIRARGRDLVSAPSDSGTDAVSIVSIHHSKGLEWPIVFLCETGKKHSFFMRDMAQPTILTSDCGFACVRRDRQTRRQFVSVPLAAVRAEKLRDLQSEELRVLYVAVTRAKEHLYITGSVKDPEAVLAAAARAAEGENSLSPAAVGEGKTFLDWVLQSLSIGGELTKLAASGERVRGLRVHTETENTVYRAANVKTAAAEIPEPDEEKALLLAGRMRRQYPHADAAALPAKLSVSALTHGEGGMHFRSMPAFLSGQSGSGAMHGTAMHLFLQSCDIAAARRDTEGEIARLSSLGILSEQQRKTLGHRQLQDFFASALASRMESCERLLREYRMLAPASASSLADEYALPGGEATMLQGVADAIMIENGSAVLIDYKTDRVDTPEELLLRYRRQLLLYRDLLGHQLGIPVREGVIYSFALGQTVQVF